MTPTVGTGKSSPIEGNHAGLGRPGADVSASIPAPSPNARELFSARADAGWRRSCGAVSPMRGRRVGARAAFGYHINGRV